MLWPITHSLVVLSVAREGEYLTYHRIRAGIFFSRMSFQVNLKFGFSKRVARVK